MNGELVIRVGIAMEADGALGGDKENLKPQLRSCRPGKRVLVEGLRGDEQAAQKKVRVGQEPYGAHATSLSVHGIGGRRAISRSWSECNLRPGQFFGGLAKEGAAQRSLFGKETEAVRKEGGALEELVAKPLNEQPEGSGTKLPALVSSLGGTLGFTIKLQRHGRASEPSGNLESHAVSAGSLASAGRFSLLGTSTRESSGPSRETDNLSSFTDSQPPLKLRAPLRKSFSEPTSVEKAVPADVVRVKADVKSVPVSGPNAALPETSRGTTPLSAKEGAGASMSLPVRRSSRNKPVSSVRDEDPTYEPAQKRDDDMPELKNKRSSRAETTCKFKPSSDDPEVAPVHVEKQSQSHEEEHSPPVTGKSPRKRAPVMRKASSEAQEESSWAHPKALKRKTPANRISTGNAQVS